MVQGSRQLGLGGVGGIGGKDTFKHILWSDIYSVTQVSLIDSGPTDDW